MYRIGIDLGGTFIKAGIVRNSADITYKTKINTVSSHSPKEVLEQISILINELKHCQEVENDKLLGIGIGLPGTVDSVNGLVNYSNNFNWLEPVKVVEILHESHKEEIKISNDANCAALGEWAFNGGNIKESSILITLGTGIGSGMVVKGKLYEGEKAGALEMGHIMIKSGGKKCTCGFRGCFEAYASTTALIKSGTKAALKKSNKNSLLYKEYKEGDFLDGIKIINSVKASDAAAKKLFNKYLFHLAEGLISINNIFRPDVIYIGGGISESFELMEEYLNKMLRMYSFGGNRGFIPEVKKASCGNDAGIIGAANLINNLTY